MLKRILLAVFMLFFFLTSINSSYAIENIDLPKQPTVLFETEEITDLDVIINKANKGTK